MAGTPLKRQRKAVHNEDGTVIAFPRVPRVAELPKDWRHWEPAEKIEHLLGMSLDDCHEVLSWPLAGLDPVRLSLKAQVLRVIVLMAGKSARDRPRDPHRREVLDQLRQMLESGCNSRRTALSERDDAQRPLHSLFWEISGRRRGWRREIVGSGKKDASHTRARDYGSLASATGAGHIPESMAGSPLKRQRKQGIRLNDGRTIAFPYMPRVADLLPGWRHFSAAQKIEHLIGLDRCYQILSWGAITELDPLRRSFQMQVMRVLLPIGIKAALDGTLDRERARERNRTAVLEALAWDLGASDKAQDSVRE